MYVMIMSSWGERKYFIINYVISGNTSNVFERDENILLIISIRKKISVLVLSHLDGQRL